METVDCDVHIGRPLAERTQPVQYATLVCKLQALDEGQVYVEAHHLQSVIVVTRPIRPDEHNAGGERRDEVMRPPPALKEKLSGLTKHFTQPLPK